MHRPRHGTPEQRRAAARFLSPTAIDRKPSGKPVDVREAPDVRKYVGTGDGYQAACRRRPRGENYVHTLRDHRGRGSLPLLTETCTRRETGRPDVKRHRVMSFAKITGVCEVLTGAV